MCFKGKSPQDAHSLVEDTGEPEMALSVRDGGVHRMLCMHRGERTPPDQLLEAFRGDGASTDVLKLLP